MSGTAPSESLIPELNKPMTDRGVLPVMTDYLCGKGIVRDTYERAILKWEQPLPTGLKTGGISVAIPHVDIHHVNEAAICVAVPKTPAPLRVMDKSDNDVPTSLIVMLAPTEAHGHIEMLQRIIKLIQNQEDAKHIVETGQSDTIHEIVKQYLLGDEN